MPFFQLFDCQSNNRKSVKKKRSVLMQAGVRLRRLRGGRDIQASFEKNRLSWYLAWLFIFNAGYGQHAEIDRHQCHPINPFASAIYFLTPR